MVFNIKYDPGGSISRFKAAFYVKGSNIIRKRTEHIDVRFHFVKQKLQEQIVQVEYLETNWQIADLLKKGLSKNKFDNFREKLQRTKSSAIFNYFVFPFIFVRVLKMFSFQFEMNNEKTKRTNERSEQHVEKKEKNIKLFAKKILSAQLEKKLQP